MSNDLRLIIQCDPEHWLLAHRAASWLHERPNQKDAIVAYGERGAQIHFYVKRTKTGMSVRGIQ